MNEFKAARYRYGVDPVYGRTSFLPVDREKEYFASEGLYVREEAYVALEAALAAATDASACPGHGRSECVSCCWPKGELEGKRADVVIVDEVPAVTVPQLEIGIYGRAFDAPGTKRAYTYKHQPANDGASKLGQACYKAMQKPGGDSIDLGLGLLKQLGDAGFGVFEVQS